MVCAMDVMEIQSYPLLASYSDCELFHVEVFSWLMSNATRLACI
jgi:hypothetical protein